MALAQRQFSLDLSQPINHHEKLHSAAHGAVLYWEQRKEANRWTKIYPSDPVAKLVAGFAGGVDTYLTVNEFFGWRHVRQLKSLRACYVDIDGSDNLEDALDILRAARLPAPSFAVFSGRGMHLYWLLEPTPDRALPVWKLIQTALIRALAGLGADPAASDCLRVLRLVGTTNGKNGREVRGVVLTDTVWTMHELADEVLGERKPKKAKVFDLSAAASRKGRNVRPWTNSIYHWWHLVYKDLCTITDHHWFGGIPEGHRDRMLFLMAVALSWYTRAEGLEGEIMATARTFTPSFSEEEIKDKIKPVLQRAERAAAEEVDYYNGREYDPRYNYKAETLRDQLAGLIPPELYPQLRTLCPAEMILQRKKERDAGRDRVAEGRYSQTREQYLQAAEHKATSARLLKAQGRTLKEISEELGVSRMTISRYLKEV